MPNSFSITVLNQSGGQQDYAFFSAPPLVSGGTSGDIWTNVMKAAPTTPNNARAKFEVSTNYYAICGSFSGNPAVGGKIEVSKTIPVALGSGSASAVTLGSTVGLTVLDKESCDLGPPTTPGQGKLGNFLLSTAVSNGHNFTVQDAHENNLMVGITTAEGADLGAALGTFTPYPNAQYQIMPQEKYYVAAGERFDAGDLVKVEMTGASIAVDFNMRGTNNVTVIHNDQNEFVFA